MLSRSLGKRIDRGEGDSIFSFVSPVLRQADIAAGNLECAIGESGTRAEKGYTFLAPPASVNILNDAGFDLLALSNNHILDYGATTLMETLDVLHSSDIQLVGAGKNNDQARAPVLITIRGIRLAFFAYADIPIEYNGFDARLWIAGPVTPGITWAYAEGMRTDIRDVRPNVDFVIIFMHFGVEGATEPSSQQIALAHGAVDSGADIVIGSHPHMLQTVEKYQEGLIFYSLGNFVFDGFSGSANSSVIAWIILEPDGHKTYKTLSIQIVDGVPILEETFATDTQ